MEDKNEFLTWNSFQNGFFSEFQLSDFPNMQDLTTPEKIFENFVSDTEDLPKKRGRKKIRPFNPVKTEVMDKF